MLFCIKITYLYLFYSLTLLLSQYHLVAREVNYQASLKIIRIESNVMTFFTIKQHFV